MNSQQICAERVGGEQSPQYSSQFWERLVNDAIVRVDTSRGFDEYLQIVDRFYADEIVLSSESIKPQIDGKDELRSFLAASLIPLDIMAELGEVRMAVHVEPIASDSLNEMHAAWTVDMIGVSGKTCTRKWRSQRIWEGSRIVYEHHYDEQQIGEPLALEDLSMRVPELAQA